MTPEQIKEILPKIVVCGCPGFCCCLTFNMAIDDCTKALLKANIGVVPSEDELNELINQNTWTVNNGESVSIGSNLAKAIRQLMLGKDNENTNKK